MNRLSELLLHGLANNLDAQQKRELQKQLGILEGTIRDVALLRSGSNITSASQITLASNTISATGNVSIDAKSSSAHTTVYVKNSDGTYQADLNVEKNIVVGGTVDGVDVSALDDPQYLTLAASATLANERILVPGAGLTGTDGGAGLNYTLAVGTPSTLTVATTNTASGTTHTHALDLSGRTITAGDGLTGGGNLGSDITLAAGAGDGIDVTADAIAVDVTDLLGTGLDEDLSNNLVLPTPGTLSVSSSNAAAAPHTHAITASSDPGATQALLKTDGYGLLKLLGLGIGAVTPVAGNLTLADQETAADASYGIIYKGATPFIHNFRHPTGNTARPDGLNTFVGLNAGNLTMGAAATGVYHASYNTAIGAFAFSYNAGGYGNVAGGVYSLYYNVGGNNNVATGYAALMTNTSGYGHIAIGANAGRYIADGTSPNQTSNKSLYLGASTKALANGDTNEIVLGYNTTGFGSNSAAYGNGSITKHIFQAGSAGFGTTNPSRQVDIELGTGNPQLRLSYSHDAAYTDFETNSSGNLEISPSGGDVSIIGSLGTTWVGSNLIPKLTDTYDLGSSTLLWRKGYLSELDTLIFAENTITLLGGWFYVTKDQGVLPADVAAAATTIDFGKDMTPNDFIVFRGILMVEYMQIGALVSGTTYNVTRNLDGTGANDWPAGTPFAVLGNTGNGRIELNAYDTPRVQVIQQGATYNAQTEVLRFGDLNGNWGYSSQTWGTAIGEYGAGKVNLALDPTNGLRLRLFAAVLGQWDNSGNITLGDSVNEHVYITATSMQIKDGATVYTDLTGGALTLGETANSKSRTQISSGAISMINRSSGGADSTYFSLDTAGDMIIGKVGAGNFNLMWDASEGDLLMRLNTTSYFQVDGSASLLKFGSNVSAAATTAIAMFGAAQTYNSESMSANDMLIGDNSASKANVLWDNSAGRLYFRGGTTQQAYIDTDGAIAFGTDAFRLDAEGMKVTVPGNTIGFLDDEMRVAGIRHDLNDNVEWTTYIESMDSSADKINSSTAWTYWDTYGAGGTASGEGRTALFMVGGEHGEYWGVDSPFITAAPGDIVYTSFLLYSSVEQDGGADFYVSIRFYDSSDTFLSSSDSSVMDLDPFYVGNTFDFSATAAPANTAKIKLRFMVYGDTGYWAIGIKYISCQIPRSYAGIGIGQNAITFSAHTPTDPPSDAATGFRFYGDSVYIDPGLLFLGDTANANMTQGLTINQGANDDEILSLKSSDIAHGATDVTETDTFGFIKKQSATDGGLRIDGFADTGSLGLVVSGTAPTSDTTKSTGGLAMVTVVGYDVSGTARANIDANGNIIAFRNNNTTRFILDGDGDSHQDVGTAWTNFDDHDDIGLLNALAHSFDPLKTSFTDFLEKGKEMLAKHRIVTYNDDGHHFINWSRTHMLEIGAIRQLAQRMERYERALLSAGIDPKLLEA